MNDAVALATAFTELLSVLVWPSVVLVVVFKFGSSIRSFLGELGELAFKGPGFEAIATRRKIEAAAALAAAGQAGGAGNDPVASTQQAKAIADVVSERITPRVTRRLRGARVLWVDDRPSNNVRVMEAFRLLGLRFVISTSTEDALSKLRQERYNAIISDMGRPPDARAGYTLLDTLRQEGDRTPLIFYASSDLPEHKEETRAHGGQGCTNRPDELLELVIAAITGE